MGFWKWFLDALAGGADRAADARAADASLDGQSEQSAVATATKRPSEGNPSRWWVVDHDSPVEPAPVLEPELTPAATGLQNILTTQSQSGEMDLPPLPRTAEQVLQQLNDPNFKLSQLADGITGDQVLTTAVLRLANCALYAGVNEITSVRDAVSRLGSVKIRTVVLERSLRAATFQHQRAGARMAEVLWRRSLASAGTMRCLAKLVGLGQDEAYLLGLLHDIGNVIVLREVREQAVVLRQTIDTDAFEYLCFKFHEQFGRLIARDWRLPEKIERIIADHHEYPGPSDPLRTERLLLELSDMIITMLGFAPDAEYDIVHARAAVDLGLAGNDAFVAQLEQVPNEIADLIG